MRPPCQKGALHEADERHKPDEARGETRVPQPTEADDKNGENPPRWAMHPISKYRWCKTEGAKDGAVKMAPGRL